MLKNKGNVLLETIIAVFIVMIVVQMITSCVQIKRNAMEVNFDNGDIVEIWTRKARWRIYHHQNEPWVDIAF